MARPGRRGYSPNLRAAVLHEIDAGKGISAVSRAYGVSRVAIYEWISEREQAEANARPLPRILCLADPLADNSGVAIMTEDGEPRGFVVWAAGVPSGDVDDLTKAIYSNENILRRLRELSEAGSDATADHWDQARRAILWIASLWQERGDIADTDEE